MITFANPYALLLLLVLPLVVFWYVRYHRHKEIAFRWSNISYLASHRRQTWRVRMRQLPCVLRMIAAACLIIVLARPQSSMSWKNRTKEGIDIMMSLDVSGTMLAEDLKPNRLKAAKSVAVDFIRSRRDDNIGLTLFAGESFTQCPLTTDHNALINLFQSVDYGILEDGTAIGLGIANSVNRLKDSKAKSKVIILLTDGSNNAGDIDPGTAADIAASFGIRIYSIGVGTRGKAKFPVETPFGKQYQEIDVDIDEPLLKAIAAKTGGQYFRATDNASLKSIYQEIDKMEKTKIEVRDYNKRNEAYLPFAMIALLLILIEVIVRETVLRKLP